MKALLVLGMLLVAVPSVACDCCCSPGAEAIVRMERELFNLDLKEAQREFRRWGHLLNSEPLDSSFYEAFKNNYLFWADRLERLQEQAIDGVM